MLKKVGKFGKNQRGSEISSAKIGGRRVRGIKIILDKVSVGKFSYRKN